MLTDGHGGGLSLLLATAPASAVGPGSEGEVEATGSHEGPTLTSQIRYTGSTGGGDGSKPGGGMAPVGDWTPPACWYEPRTAKEFAKYMEDAYDSVVNMPGQHSYAKTSAGQTRQYYKDGEYKNYNLKKSDEGLWWVAVRDEDRWMEEGAKACSEPPAWVENGETPVSRTPSPPRSSPSSPTTRYACRTPRSAWRPGARAR